MNTTHPTTLRAALNQIGQRTEIVTPNGSYSGRIIDTDTERVLLKDGAGYWTLPLTDIIGYRIIQTATKPAATEDEQAANNRAQTQHEHEQAARVLSRWP